MDFKMKLIILIVWMLTLAKASKVLMVLPLGSPSHKNIFTPLAENLSKKGHSVTLVSLYESRSRNQSYSDVAATSTQQYMKNITGEMNIFKMIEQGIDINRAVMKLVIKNIDKYCEHFLNDPAVQHVWEDKPDLIMLPAFMNECGLILVEKFKVPFIYVTTSGLVPWTADLVGNPEHPAYIPNQYLGYGQDMTLIEKTYNTVARFFGSVIREKLVLNELDHVAQRFLGNSSTKLAEVEKSVNFVLVNSHHSLGFPRPLVPNVVEVGGMHCRESRLIKNDPTLNKFLNDAGKNNAILFSLGSHIKSKDMPKKVLQMFINAFAKLPYSIVWKWEGALPENLPSNVIVRNWVNQQDILGHRSLGGFFTHGGLLSTQEAIYHGVPIVGLPMMSDQHLNVKQAVSMGIGLQLDIATLTADDIVDSLKRIMEDSSFRSNVELRSSVMKDQETKPLDRATYWTEYVLRHNGANHLKSASSDLSTVQYYLLDVISVIILISFVVLVVFLVLLYLISKLMSKLAYKIAKKIAEINSNYQNNINNNETL